MIHIHMAFPGILSSFFSEEVIATYTMPLKACMMLEVSRVYKNHCVYLCNLRVWLTLSVQGSHNSVV